MRRNELEWADSDVSLNNYFSASNIPSLQLLKLQVLNLVQIAGGIPHGVRLMNSRCCLKVTSSVQNISALLDVGLKVLEVTDDRQKLTYQLMIWNHIFLSQGFHLLHWEKFKVLCSHWRCPIGRSQSVTEGMICSMWVKVYGQCADNCSSTR